MASILIEYDPKNRVIQFPSVSNPAGWPRAPSDKVCIFEALQIVGKAKHGEAWSGLELDTVWWLESPKAEYARSTANADQRASSRPIPAPLNNPNMRHPVMRANPSRQKLSHHDHIRAWKLELREVRWRNNWEALGRLKDTVEWMAQQCRDGALPAYARPKAVGTLWTMQPWEWNIENVLQHIVSNGGCQRYFVEIDKSFDSYVFFDRSELKMVTATLAHAPLQITAQDLGKLSPYLRLAVQLALSKNYVGPDQDETQPIRQAEVRAAWPDALGGVPQSKNAIEAIAKVMGFPDPIAIEQGQKRRNEKK